MLRSERNILASPDVSKSLQRRMTAGTNSSTEMTASMSSMGSSGSFDSPLKSVGEDGIMMNLIKQEMVQSLTRVTNSRMGNSDEEVKKTTDAAIRKLATLVLEGGDFNDSEDKLLKPDQSLRDLLRDAMLMSDGEEEESSSPASVALSSTENTSILASTQASTTKGAGMKDSPLDIWHPDFWETGAESLKDETATNTSIPGASFGTPSRSSRAGTDGGDSKDSHQSLQEFLANLQIASDSDVSDDDLSVLSDLTGLTEAFPEDKERRTVAEAKRSKVLLDTAPVMKSVSTKRNRDGQSKVVFGDVVVRKYKRILTDNPACTSGPSIGIGWSYQPQTPVSVDEFERVRRPKRNSSDLMMNRRTREKIVRRGGHTDKEIAEMMRAVNKVKNQRRQTLNNTGVEKVEFAVEMAKRRLKSMLFLKGKNLSTNY
jgi:hypothetical protein